MPPLLPLFLLFLLLPLLSPQCLSSYQYTDFTTNLCHPCPISCYSCFTSTICTQCNSQYYLTSNNTCQKCQFGCSVCTDSTTCTTCIDGLYMNGKGECISCNNGVETCTIATVMSCQDGYFMLGDICAGCFSNCKQCRDFVTCSTCMLGYYLTPSQNSCQPCPSNCRICTSSTTCIQCSLGYTQSPSSGCQLSSCTHIDPFCLSCTTTSLCLSCQQGKHLSNNQCLQGSSLLCVEANGEYNTDCGTSSYGCMGYGQVGKDGNGNDMGVCLAKRAGKEEEYGYWRNQDVNCNGYSTCTDSNTVSLSFTNSQNYYQVQLYLMVRMYSTNPSRSITVNIIDQNNTTLTSSTISTTTTAQLSAFPTSSDPSCLSCPFSTQLLTTTLPHSGSSSPLSLIITDSAGLLTILQTMFILSICQVNYCSTCSSAVDCSACHTPYLLQQTTCVTQCDTGFYQYQNTCYLECPSTSYTVNADYTCASCVTPCATCSSATVCLSCVNNYYLEGTQCLISCSVNTLFPNATTLVCQTCPNPCITCALAPNSTSTVQCLTCASGYLYTQGTCIFICPQGYYGIYTNGSSKCLQCSLGCRSCYLNSTTCTSCTTPFLLLSTTCYNMSTCPQSYYIDPILNKCTQCQYPCRTCSTNATICTSCVRGMLFMNQCANQCPDGYYADYGTSGNISCMGCGGNCVYCLAATLCTACANNTYLYNNTCTTICPDSYYPQPSNHTCNKCTPPCQTCTTSTSCLSCATGYLNLINCTLQCNQTSYISSNFICTLCHSPCLTCRSSTICLTCQLPYLSYNDQECITVEECQNNYTGYYPSYYYNGSGIQSASCAPCAFPCGSCQNSSVTCTACVSNYYFTVQTNKCYANCPTSYFVQNSTLCSKCDSNCYTCITTAPNCTSCANSLFLSTTTHTCLSSCPSQYYGDDQTQTCLPCLSPCLQCYNPYLCITCSSGILYNKQCLDTCPQATFYNSSNNQCISCTNNCYTCGGTNTSHCLSCNNGYYLLNNTCLASCPTQYYQDQYAQTCQICISPCLECSSASACLKCVSGYYYNDKSKQCLTSCGTGYYTDNNTFMCQQCNSTICMTCEGGANNCLTCVSGYYLHNNSCIQQCPSGYYGDSIQGQCQSCPFPCQTCLNYTYCNSCLPSYYSFSSRCFSQCPLAYYSDPSSSCLPCLAICQLCTDNISCIQCVNGRYLMNSTCVEECPLGYYMGYQAITNYDQCMVCQVDCRNCSSYQYCQQCNNGLIQFNGLCLTQCPIFYFADNNTTCLSCSQYCSSCLNQTYCLACIGTYLHNHTCIKSCPSLYYPTPTSSCSPCLPPCLQCTGDYTCTTCLQSYIYFHSYCISKCPSDIWYYPQNNTCQIQCPYNKLQNNMTCYVGSCGERMVSLNGYCLEECGGNGEYYVSMGQECKRCEDDGEGRCSPLFGGYLEVLYMDELTLMLYYNQQAQIVNISDVQVSMIDIDNNPITTTLTSYQITPFKLQLKYTYKQISLVNITLSLPYITSTTTSQRISTNTFKIQLPSYQDYSTTANTANFIVYVPVVFFMLLVVLAVVNIVNKASRFVQMLDYVQLVAVTLYLDIQYPPILEQFLSGFRISLLAISNNLANITPYTFAPPKFIYYHTDTLLFRTLLPLLLIFLLTLLIFTIVIIINTCKPNLLKKPTKQIRYRLINDLFSFCITPLFLFACQFGSTPSGMLVISVGIVVLGLAYVGWISYKIMGVKKMSQLSGLIGDFERTQSKIGLMYIPFAFLRRIIFTLGLGIAPYSPIATITLLLVLTFLIMVCIYFYQPFDNQYTDYITIFMQSSLTLFVICLIMLGLDVFQPENAHNLGMFIVGLVCVTMAVCIGWLGYLTVMDVKNKGWCPEDKKDEEKGSDDYTEKKYQQDQEQIRKMQGLQPLSKGKIQQVGQNPIKQDSAHQLINRFGSGSDQLFSKNDNNEQFKHWSEESSNNAPEESLPKGQRKQIQGSMPYLLVKVEKKEVEKDDE